MTYFLKQNPQETGESPTSGCEEGEGVSRDEYSCLRVPGSGDGGQDSTVFTQG